MNPEDLIVGKNYKYTDKSLSTYIQPTVNGIKKFIYLGYNKENEECPYDFQVMILDIYHDEFNPTSFSEKGLEDLEPFDNYLNL